MNEDKVLDRIDRWAAAYARWVIRWKWAVLTGALITALVISAGAGRLTFNDDYRYFFKADNPQLLAYDAVQDMFTKNDGAIFSVAPEDGDVFTGRNLAAIEELTREAWKLPFSSRVDSVTNFQHSYAEGDSLVVEDLVESPLELTKEELAAKKATALSEKQIVNRLLSPSGHVAGVSVILNLPADVSKKKVEFTEASRELAARIEARYPGVKVRISGNIPMDAAFYELSMRDMRTIIPLMYAGIILTMLLLLRSLSATGASVVVIGFSAATGLGLAGWLGIPMSAPSTAAPTLILTLAVADSIHILVTMLSGMGKGLAKDDALAESLRLNLQPVFLTSLTTVIGFLSMNASKVQPLRDLGNITAMGVAAAFFYSVVLLPALMAILPVRPRSSKETGSAWPSMLGEFVIRNRRRLLWGTTVVVLGFAAFVPANELNDRWVEYFSESTRIRQDSDFMTSNLSGSEQVEFSLGSGETGGIANPEYLRKIDEFAAWYRARPNVLAVTTLSDVVKKLNMNLHGDDPAYYRVPESRALAAQQLLLYEMSVPFGLDLNNTIDVDKSATRAIVSVGDVTTKELQGIVADGEEWLRRNAPEAMFSYGVGPGVMFANISAVNIKSTLGGAAAALVIISLVLIIALRSLKFGIISLIPNLVPAAAAFGIWGIVNGRVGLGLSIVSGMTLGIVVDDTVHFLSKYLRSRRAGGGSPEQAVRYAFKSVAPAMTVTSVILMVGFGILSISDYNFNGDMGRLTAVTIGVALLVDLLMLPPLLLAFDKSEGGADEGSRHEKEASSVSV